MTDAMVRMGVLLHPMSWLIATGREGDYFVSDASVVTEDGCEVLTIVPQHSHVV